MAATMPARSARAGRCGARRPNHLAPASLGEHLGAAPPRVLLGLEHHHAGALAEHEAVPALVERARGALGLVVTGGQRPHAANAAMSSGTIAASVPPASTTSARPTGSCPSRSRWPRRPTRRRSPWCAPRRGAEFDADPPRRSVRHEHRHRERRHALPAALAQRVVSDRGWWRSRRCRWTRPPRAAPVGASGAPGVRPRLPGRRRSRTARTGRAAGTWTRSSTVAGSTAARAAIRAAGSAHPSSVSAAAPTAPGQHALPGARHVAAERGGRSEAGDHDTWLVCPHSSSAPSLRCRRGRAGAAASGPGDQAETSARRT